MIIKRHYTLIILLLVCIVAFPQNRMDSNVIPTTEAIIYDICYSNHGTTLGVADGKNIKFFSLQDYTMIGELMNGHTKQILTLDISRDSTLVASGGKDSTIILWDVPSNSILRSLDYHNGIVTSVKISQNGQYLVSGGTDNKVCVFNLEDMILECEFTDSEEDIISVDISPNNRLVATACGDKLVRIYDVNSKTMISSFPKHSSWVRDVIFSMDGNILVSCGDDSKVNIWNVSDLSNIQNLAVRGVGNRWLLSVDLHSDNESIATAGMDGVLRVFSKRTIYETKIGKPIHKVIFNPSDTIYLKVALATRGRGVLLIDADQMKVKPIKK